MRLLERRETQRVPKRKYAKVRELLAWPHLICQQPAPVPRTVQNAAQRLHRVANEWLGGHGAHTHSLHKQQTLNTASESSKSILVLHRQQKKAAKKQAKVNSRQPFSFRFVILIPKRNHSSILGSFAIIMRIGKCNFFMCMHAE